MACHVQCKYCGKDGRSPDDDMPPGWISINTKKISVMDIGSDTVPDPPITEAYFCSDLCFTQAWRNMPREILKIPAGHVFMSTVVKRPAKV